MVVVVVIVVVGHALRIISMGQKRTEYESQDNNPLRKYLCRGKNEFTLGV